MIKQETIRGVCLARHLYEIGRDNLRGANDLRLFAAVNLLQDAVEAFLIAVAGELGVSIDTNTNFDRYFALINEVIKPEKLPFKHAMVQLNKLRVNAKHHSIQPSREECGRLALSVREFFDEVASTRLGVSFATVSAIDLIDEGEIKDLLIAAKEALNSNDYTIYLIACRKAIYLKIEWLYNIEKFKKGDLSPLGRYSKAPWHARNEKYILESVFDPTDFVVIDHSQLDQDLLKQGVDSTKYWNVWRLTPKVVKLEDGRWVYRHDFELLEPDDVSETAEYVFSATIDVLIAISTNEKKTKWRAKTTNWVATLRYEGIDVYEKADRKSKVRHKTPSDLKEIEVDYRVTGLNNDGLYWHASHFAKDSPWISGFIHEDDLGLPISTAASSAVFAEVQSAILTA